MSHQPAPGQDPEQQL